MKDKTQIWIALSGNKIVGYLLEYDQRVLQLRGQRRCAIPLLKNSDLNTPLFNIESKHTSAVRGQYKPIEPADTATTGLMTTFLIMRTTAQTFTPMIRHKVQELKKSNAKDLAELFGAEPKRTQDLLKGIAFGIFKGEKLVSCAASPDILEDLAIIRGVKTAPEERGQGYATSVCSAVVQKLHQMGREGFLYVSKDNLAAVKVYTKIGFKETGHVFLSFLAERKKQS
jgi:RimJ/RimL family protein N-acetyltransferase